MIRLQNISKSFGPVTAVQDISFEVKAGEKLVLLGTSGCGKTTTLRMINRLILPDAGEVLVNGVPGNKQSPELLRRHMGYVLQHHGLFPHYTVAQNIAIVPRLLKWDEPKIRQRTHYLLEKLRIDPGKFADAYPATLSGGQQQRVGLARALAADPPLLLMDEPFGALDPISRAAIRQELLQLEEFRNKTIILVTHDVQEAFEIGDRICLMDKGRIVQIGTPPDFLFNPANAYVQHFIGAQRLLLLYKSIRIADIMQMLPEATMVSPSVLESHATLWQAMEILSTGDAEYISIRDAQSGTYRQAGVQELIRSIKKVNTIAHG